MNKKHNLNTLPTHIRSKLQKKIETLTPQSEYGIDKKENTYYEHLNPIPYGPEGVATLREATKCPIPKDAHTLTDHVTTLIRHKTTDEDVHSKIDTVVSHCLGVGIRGRRHCDNQLKTRHMCSFNADETLNSINSEIKLLDEKLNALQTEIQEVAKKEHSLLEKRYKYCVNNFGLSPEKHFYWINEDKNCIEQVSLDCKDCKSVTKFDEAKKCAQDLINSLNTNE